MTHLTKSEKGLKKIGKPLSNSLKLCRLIQKSDVEVLGSRYKKWTKDHFPDVLINRPRIDTICKIDDKSFVHVSLAIRKIIVELNEFYTTKMSNTDINNTLDVILEKFPLLSIEDFYVFKRKSMMGEFGNNYNRLNGAVICSWLTMYEDKYVIDAREKLRHNQKIATKKDISNTIDLAVKEGKKHGIDLSVRKKSLEIQIKDTQNLFWFSNYKKEIAAAQQLEAKDEMIKKINLKYKYELERYNRLREEFNVLK